MPLAKAAPAEEISRMKSVAVIGASSDRSRFGNKAVRAFGQKGYTVYAVNPTESIVEGIPTYWSVAELPVRPDLVSVCRSLVHLRFFQIRTVPNGKLP